MPAAKYATTHPGVNYVKGCQCERCAGRRQKERDRHAANPEKKREGALIWAAANREKIRQRGQLYRAATREKKAASRMLRAHGMWPEDWAKLWDAQRGLCYLCGEELAGNVSVDHDHDHCASETSCGICRRGLAHDICNVVIGQAGDDPDRLRRMAGALEAAQQAYQARKAVASTSVQLALAP